MRWLLVFAVLFSAQAQATIDEVVVTHKRSTSPRSESPSNISLTDPKTARTAFPADLLNRVPAVHVHRGSGQEHLTAIRSPVLTGGAGAGSFLYLEDNVPLRAAGFANVNALMDTIMADATRIEVIRGPGSALYGSNAVHGLVNVITAPATTPARTAHFSSGSYHRYNATLASGFKTSGQPFRLVLNANGDLEGARADSYYAQQKLRLKTQGRAGDMTYHLTLSAMNLNQETAGYVSSYRNKAIAKSNNDSNAHRDAWSLRLAAHFEKPLGNNRFFRFTPYLRSNEMDFTLHFLADADPLEKNRHSSLGIQTALHNVLDDTHEIVFGIDGEVSKGALWQNQTAPTQFGFLKGLHYDYDVKATMLSPYIQADWTLSPHTTLITGLRGDLVIYDYDNHAPDGDFGAFLRPADRTDRFETTSPKLALTHRLKDIVFFANLSRGTRAPQTSDAYRLRVGQSVGTIRPENLDSLELGLRGKAGKVQYELTTYAMKKRNYHFRDSENANVSNGKTTHEGIELDMSGYATEKLFFTLALAYGRHQYDFTHPANGIVSGTDIDSAPRLLTYAMLNYGLTPTTRLIFDSRYVSRYATNEARTHFYNGHALFGLGIDWHITPSVLLQFSISNVFDRTYARRADFAFGSGRYYPGEGRAWSLGLDYSF